MNKFQHCAHPVLLIGEPSAVLKGVDTSPVVTARLSAQGITLTTQMI